MSVFNLINQAAVADQPSDNTVIDSLRQCQNTTVGEDKYQMYCINRTDPVGKCELLPAKYTGGDFNCFTVLSQTFLQQLYKETGNACAIFCYYPSSVDNPPINIPTFTFPPLDTPSLTAGSGPTTTTRALITTTTTQVTAATSGPQNGANDIDLPDLDLPATNGTTAASRTSGLASPNSLLNFTILLCTVWILVRKFCRY